MYFASTERLNLREHRESDANQLFDLLSAPYVQRTGPAYVVPKGPALRKLIPNIPDTSLISFIVEVKDSEPLPAGEDVTGANSNSDDTTGSGDSEERKGDTSKSAATLHADLRFVGIVSLLRSPLAKSRDSELALALHERYWGRGYGTELIRWLTNYAFDQLALHRVSLHVMEGNERAVKMYKKL